MAPTRIRLSLYNARKKYFNIDEFKDINYNDYIISTLANYVKCYNITSELDICKIKLQIICVLGNIIFLKQFITEFLSNHGSYALQLLLNAPFTNIITIKHNICMKNNINCGHVGRPERLASTMSDNLLAILG